jgi:hypothetical protein
MSEGSDCFVQGLIFHELSEKYDERMETVFQLPPSDVIAFAIPCIEIIKAASELEHFDSGATKLVSDISTAVMGV